MGGAGRQRDLGPSAYIVAGWLGLVLSLTGLFGRLLVSVPRPILAAVLASVFLLFVRNVTQAVLVSPLVAGIRK